MKQAALTLSTFLLFTTAGTKGRTKKEVQGIDLSEYNMKIIPDHPTSTDEIKLVVYNDYSHDVLSEVDRRGQTIVIQKQFNSMLKRPCVIQNDTIVIGQLPKGTYTVSYKLVDLSCQVIGRAHV